MVKTHYTQGPWVVKHSESKDAWNIVGTLLGGKHKIARVPYLFIGEAEMAQYNEKMRNEAKANATLIAAAPMMLKALQYIHSQHHEGAGNLEFLVEQAINQATIT